MDEVHTGEYLYSIFMPAGCLIVGYGVCLLFMRSTARAGRGIVLPASLGTAQKGSQALICSLIFAMGQFPVAGVVALGSSVITVVLLVIIAAEIGKRQDKRPPQPVSPVITAEPVRSPRPPRIRDGTAADSAAKPVATPGHGDQNRTLAQFTAQLHRRVSRYGETPHPWQYRKAFFASGGASGSRMDREMQNQPPSVFG